MNDELKIMNFWACPSVELSAISFLRKTKKDAASIPHANKQTA